MDTTGLHIRSLLTLDQNYAENLPVAQVVPTGPQQRRTLTFVADTVTFSGATFTDVDVVVVAREVTGSRISLRSSSEAVAAAENNGVPGTGSPGFALTVLCTTLNAQGASSFGGRGGKGIKGEPGDPHPPVSHDPHDGPFPKPPKSERGNPGKQGGKGGPGGPGGPLIVQCEVNHSIGSWESAGGPGGFGGDGGDGGPASDGTGEHIPGPQGPKGDGGDVPPSTFLTPSAVTHPALVGAIQNRGLGTAVADAEARTARFQIGTISLEVAADRRSYSREFGFGDLQLDYRITMDASALPVERDLELIPDVPQFVARSKKWRKRLAAALVPPGLAAGKAELDDVAGRLRDLLNQQMDDQTGTLGVINSEAVQRKAAAVAVRTTADTRVLGLRDRILQEFPAVSFTAGGVTFTGSEFQDRVGRELLDAAALPSAPDLVVSRSLRNSGTGYATNRLAVLRAAAMGLAGSKNTAGQNSGPAGWAAAMSSRALDVSRVRAELVAARAAASGITRERFGVLVELLEQAQAALLAALRTEQAQFTLDTGSLRTTTAIAALAVLNSLSSPADPSDRDHITRQGDLLRGLSVVMEHLGYHLAQERQAIKLFTVGTAQLLGTGGPAPINLHPDLFAGVFPDPDRPEDAREIGLPPLGAAAAVAPAIAAIDNSHVIEEYLGRGTGMGLGAAAGGPVPGPSHAVDFGPGSPEFLRFVDSKRLWFDVPLADLTGASGLGSHREIKVIGARVRLDGVGPIDPEGVPPTPIPEMTVRLVHSGTSEQRVLSGTGQRLVQLPASIKVTLAPEEPLAAVTVSHGATVVGSVESVETGQQTVLPLNFAPYARGVAAGWTLEVVDGDVSLDQLASITVDLVYGTVLPTGAITLAAITSDRTSLQSGTTATATARLTAPAGSGGFRVDLGSADAAIAVPASVTVPAGAVTATFPITAVKVASGVRLTARGQDGLGRRTYLAVQAAAEATQAAAGDKDHTVNVVRYLPARGNRAAAVLAGVALPRPSEGQPAAHGKLVRFTPGLDKKIQIEIGSEPRAIVYDPQRNALYVLAGFVVAMLDADTLVVRAQREVGFTAVDLAVEPLAGELLVSQLGPGRVLVWSADDLSDRQVVTDLPAAFRLSCAPGTDLAYVMLSSKADAVAGVTQLRRRRTGWSRGATVKIEPALLVPQDVLFDPKLNRVYVACQGNVGAGAPSVLVYSATLQLLRDIPLPGPARALSGVPGSATLTVATDRGAIQVDTSTGAIGDLAAVDKKVPITVEVDAVSGVAYLGDRLDGSLMRLPLSITLPSAEWT